MGGADKIALIFPVLIVCNQYDFSLAQVVQYFFYGVESFQGAGILLVFNVDNPGVLFLIILFLIILFLIILFSVVLFWYCLKPILFE